MDKAALAAPAAGDGGIFGLYGEKRKISLCVPEKDANGNEVPCVRAFGTGNGRALDFQTGGHYHNAFCCGLLRKYAG